MAFRSAPFAEPRPASRPPAGAHPLARSRLATGVGALVLLGGLGCGSQTPDASGVDDSVVTATEAPADAPPGTVTRLARTEGDREPRTTFPHDPHRAIACRTCHLSVAGHATHGQIECTECHDVPERYDSLRVLSARECLECHHRERADVTCGNCHRPSTLAGEVPVRAALHVAAAKRTRQEQLPFDHRWHAELNCADCHAPSVLHEFGKECRTCHVEHHRSEARCASCHQSVDRPVHAEAAHNGCGGVGCHVDPRIVELPPVRSVCLGCHTDMEDHERDRECAACHAIPESWPRHLAAPRGSR